MGGFHVKDGMGTRKLLGAAGLAMLVVLVFSLGIAAAATYVTSWGSHGSGPGQFQRPHDVAVDSRGHVYVADTNNDRIQKFTRDGGFLRAWGGGEYPDPSRLLGPQGVAVDARGNVYVANTATYQIKKFSSDGQFLDSWKIRGGPHSRNAHQPFDVAVTHRHVYVTDKHHSRVAEFTTGGRFLRVFGHGGSGRGEFHLPCCVAADPEGPVYVTDTGNSRIEKFTPTGGLLNNNSAEGTEPGKLKSPTGCRQDGVRNAV